MKDRKILSTKRTRHQILNLSENTYKNLKFALYNLAQTFV